MKKNNEKKNLLLEKLAKLNQEQKNQILKKLKLDIRDPATKSDEKNQFAKNLPYCVVSKIPGSLSSFSKKNIEIPPPEHNQVQIRAKSVSLNFRDLMIALNLYPKSLGIPTSMGSDYAGIVEKCGESITELKPGDEVISLYAGNTNPDLHFSSTVNAYIYQTVKKPKVLSFSEAATLPTAFLTAYFGLVHLGRLKKGEKVLIHSATGGVGLAAMQIANHYNAEIFATAGNDEKRDFLKTLGVSNPMDSRSLNFVDEIMDLTEKKGVDLILNTLSGDAIDLGMKILSKFGRFIQIEKGEIYNHRPLDLGYFKNGQTFSFVDLSLFHMNETAKSLLTELMTFFQNQTFHPIRKQEFLIEKIGQALNFMSKSKHIGKIVLNYDS